MRGQLNVQNGKEFHRTDAATENERRPTVDRRNGGTCSSCNDDERSRRRPGRSADRRLFVGLLHIVQIRILLIAMYVNIYSLGQAFSDVTIVSLLYLNR